MKVYIHAGWATGMLCLASYATMDRTGFVVVAGLLFLLSAVMAVAKVDIEDAALRAISARLDEIEPKIDDALKKSEEANSKAGRASMGAGFTR